MRLTSKGRYAVMAMADLALHGGAERPVPLSDIAARQEISLSYLEQLFAGLRKSGLVRSLRGPGGGYRLAVPMNGVSVAQIVAAVNEPIKATRCNDGSLKSCMGKPGKCIAHDLWSALGDEIALFLSRVTLEDVVERRVGAALVPDAA